MSFGLSRGKQLDPAPGEVGFTNADLPPLPDDLLENPEAARLDLDAWFPARAQDPSRPLDLEIGPGKGTFLLQQAELEPGTDFLGIEWAKEFFTYAADRVRRRGLTNVRLLHADATEFLRWRVGDGVLRVIHLYFSDPWPKKRHHKNRVVQDAFLTQAHRTLMPGGELRVVTDHADLWAWDEAHFERWCSPAPDADTPGYDGPRPAFERQTFDRPESAGEHELVGTNFERKYREEGRDFYAVTLLKPAGSEA
ncbi:MAG: tRNA (guanosine(46)-N7)-methyltransferase TrmB [Planctomycetota bacterium]